MSSATGTSRPKRRRRGVTRRVRDERGNITVKRYTRKGSRLSTPDFLKFFRLPTTLIGGAMFAWAFAIYDYTRKVNDGETPLFERFFLVGPDLGFQNGFYFGMRDLADAYNDPFFRFWMMGTIAIGLYAFLGFALFSKGIKVRYWPGAFRQLFAVMMASIVLLAVFSPFINEPQLIRQQEDLEDDDRNFDLDKLSSPFYAELLNGLLDLLGNIPDPLEVAATVRNPGGTIDATQDRHLYRWQVAETYDTDINDFTQAFTGIVNPYVATDPTVVSNLGGREYRISEQYLTLTAGYSGEALALWNSEFGAPVGNLADVDADVIESLEGEFVAGSATGNRDINEQPVLQASFTQARTQGFINYDSYWIPEDKQSISTLSIPYDELATELLNVDTIRFGNRVKTLGFDNIWGQAALPGGAAYAQDTGSGLEFMNEFDTITSGINEDTTVYGLALQISNSVQNAVINNLILNQANIDPTTVQEAAPAGEDKAYWFYDALANDGEFGMKELLAGFTNMLRAFSIPARPVIGFSVGEFLDTNGNDCGFNSVNCDSIELRFEHLHVWIEALVPWRDAQNNVHFSWGIFNPIPDPYIWFEEGELEFGRNALGGAPEIIVDISSGNVQDLGTTIEGQSSFSINKLGSNVTGGVRLTYDGIPAVGQPITMKLLSGADADGIDLDSLDIGIDLNTTNTDSEGWANFTLGTNRDLELRQFDENGLSTTTGPLGNITTFDPLAIGQLEDMGVFALVAFFSVSFNISVIAWEFNATLDLQFDPPTPLQSIINPFDSSSINSYGIRVGQTANITVTVTEDGLPIPGLEGVELLFLDQAVAQNLFDAVTNADLGTVNNIKISNRVDIFGITDINGRNTRTIDFSNLNVTLTEDEIYIALAILDTKFNDPIYFWYSDDVTLNSTLDTFGITFLDNAALTPTNNTQTWEVTVNAEAFSTGGVFPPEPGDNVTITFYAIEDSIFVGIADYNDLSTVITTCGAGCVDLNTNTSLVSGITVGANFATDIFGILIVNITLYQTAFSTGTWHLVTVALDSQAYATASGSGFWAVSGPSSLALENQNFIKLERITQQSIAKDVLFDQNNTTIHSVNAFLILVMVLNFAVMVRRIR